MENMNLHSFVVMVFLGIISKTEGRQMCLSCQYVENPKQEGIECSTAPRNWTLGDTRVRCNFRCMTVAHFDKKTGVPLYAYRGCTSSDDATNDGCSDDEVKEYCSFTCADVDYCNDRSFAKAPSLESAATVMEKYHFLVLTMLLLFILM